MHRHFILTARIAAAALLAGFLLLFALPGAQAQDANKQLGDLVTEVSVLSKQVCGVTAPTDPDAKKLYDERKQTLTDDANQLSNLLDQQKPKGSGFPDKILRDNIDAWEKSLAVDPKDPKSCPVVPDDLQKVVSGGAPAGAAPTFTALQQVKVAPSSVTFDQPQTIGTLSSPTTVTVTNTSTDNLDIFVWYGLHLDNFWVSDDTCNGITPPQGTCTFKVAFGPREMPAPGNQQLYETLWIVRHEDWKAFEKVRLAYKQLADAQAAVENAASEVRNQMKVLKSTADAIQFCEGATGADVEACTGLTNANIKFNEVKKAKPNESLDDAANDLRDKALTVPLEGTPIHWKYPLTRGVVGLDVSAVSSKTVRQAYFVDFNLLAPFRLLGNHKDALENRWWFWLNPRITSLPQAASTSALSTIDQTGTFFTNFSSQGKVTDIAQGFDVNGGLELVALKPRDGIPWWGEYVNTQARLGASFIVGGGISTPFSVDNTDVPSQVNQSICDAFKAPAGNTVSGPSGLVCTFPTDNTGKVTSNNPVIVAPNPVPGSSPTAQDGFIDFFTPERSRFFRRWYAGLRLKTYFFSPDVRGDCDKKRTNCDAPYDIFPGIIDITAGQDEAVTAGHLSTILFRAEAVYPLPFVPGLHIFGSIYTSWKGNKKNDPPFNFYTINAPTNGASNDFNTFRFALPPLERDYFRVGIGLDLIQVLKHGKGGQPAATTSTPSSQNASSTTTSSGSSGTSKTP